MYVSAACSSEIPGFENGDGRAGLMLVMTIRCVSNIGKHKAMLK